MTSRRRTSGTVKGVALRSGFTPVKRGVPAVLAAVCMVLASIAPAPAFAVQPGEVLENATMEKRARKISLGLRCLVCQNQSIDDSDAPLAKDLRVLVRERLQAGDTNDEVEAFVVARYGEFVLLKPPFGWHTLVLWVAPFVVLIGGVWLARRSIRAGAGGQGPAGPGGRRRDAALTSDEQAKINVLLDQKDR